MLRTPSKDTKFLAKHNIYGYAFHTYIHTCIYIHIHTYRTVSTSCAPYRRTPSSIHTDTHKHIHTYTYTYIQDREHVLRTPSKDTKFLAKHNIYGYALIIGIHTYIHIHIHTYTYTYIQDREHVLRTLSKDTKFLAKHNIYGYALIIGIHTYIHTHTYTYIYIYIHTGP